MLKFVSLLILLLVGCSTAVPLAASNSEPCEDTESAADCASWASSGYCEAHRDLMSQYCPATCGVCKTVAEGAEIVSEIMEKVTDATRGDTYNPYSEDTYNYDSYDPYGEDTYNYDSYDPYGEDTYNYDSYEPYGEDTYNYEDKYDADDYVDPYASAVDEIAEKLDETTETSTGECEIVVKNGKVVDLEKPGSYGRVECEEGFTLDGSEWLYCDYTGVITGDVATCNRKCSDVTLTNGEATLQSEEPNGWIIFSCNEGYTLNGEAWSWCENGELSVVSTCDGAGGETDSTTADEEPDYGYEESDTWYEEPDYGYEEPDYGYEESDTRYEEPDYGYKDTDYSEGRDEYDYGSEEAGDSGATCTEATISNGVAELQESMAGSDGVWILFSCNGGYTLTGDAWAWCAVDQKLTTMVTPTCVYSGDGASGEEYGYEGEEYAYEYGYEDEDYGSDQGSEDTYYGSDDSDYGSDDTEGEETTGEEVVTGGDYGGCPLETVINGKWTDPYETTTYWILECDEGYVREGGDEYSYCNDMKVVSGLSPTCKEDPCAKITLENGSVEVSTPEGGWAYVQGTCNEGYEMAGASGGYCDTTTGSPDLTIGPCKKI